MELLTKLVCLKCSFTKGISDEEVPTKKSVPEEKWRATPKKGKTPKNGTYMKPPKQSLHFSPHTDEPKRHSNPNKPEAGFSAFKSEAWKQISISTASSSIKECLREVKKGGVS